MIKKKNKNHVYIDWCVTDTHSHTHTDTVLQYGRARTNILWKLTHTANLMKKQKKSNFRELKSEHNVQRCEPIKLDERRVK